MKAPRWSCWLAGALVLLSGCTIPLSSTPDPAPSWAKTWRAGDDAVSETPPPAPAPTTTRTVAAPKSLSCKSAPTGLLKYLQGKDGYIGGAIQYRQGKMVQAGGGWWVVAIKLWKDPSSDIGEVDDYDVWLTNYPSAPKGRAASMRTLDTSRSPAGEVLAGGPAARDTSIRCLGY